MAAKTTDERIASIEAKINKKRAEITALEEQKQKLMHPVTMRAVIAKAKESGMTAEDIAQKLGIEI